MSIDLDALLRRWKPEKRKGQLRPRPAADLVPAASVSGARRLPLVPDTTVYIHNAAGTLPSEVETLLDGALQWHCSVCLGELTTGIANYSPAAPGWRGMKDVYAEVFHAIPDSRVLTPDDDAWLSAGLISGTLARTQGLQRHQRKELLNDALIYLTAAKAGLPVLTANRDEFDLVQQIAGTGLFIHYAPV